MRDTEYRVTRKSYLRTIYQGIIALSGISIMNLACSDDTSSTIGCVDCPLRKRYDADPTSLVARMWKWHIEYCPGWKSYLRSLSDAERKKIVEQYQ